VKKRPVETVSTNLFIIVFYLEPDIHKDEYLNT